MIIFGKIFTQVLCSALFTALASYIHPPGAGYYPDEEENPDEENLNNWSNVTFFRHSPFLAGELIALDASSLFFPPSTLRPFLRSSLKDMLQVPQRNLWKTADVRSQSFVWINLQLVDPFFSTLPQRQKRSSSSRQARLGFPSLTLSRNILTVENLRKSTCSSPGSASQSETLSAGNHRSSSRFFTSGDTTRPPIPPFWALKRQE